MTITLSISVDIIKHLCLHALARVHGDYTLYFRKPRQLHSTFRLQKLYLFDISHRPRAFCSTWCELLQKIYTVQTSAQAVNPSVAEGNVEHFVVRHRGQSGRLFSNLQPRATDFVVVRAQPPLPARNILNENNRQSIDHHN
jgi:hypothetical protein